MKILNYYPLFALLFLFNIAFTYAGDVSQLNGTMTFIDSDWTYINQDPKPIIRVTNTSITATSFKLTLEVRNERNQLLETIERDVEIGASEQNKTFRDTLKNLEPGFYRLYVKASQASVKQLAKAQIGYNPEQIQYNIDRQPDFFDFWEQAKTELTTVAPDYQLTLLETTANHNIYEVSIKSTKNAIIKGYYSEPKAEGRFPAILVACGYGSNAWKESKGNFALFVYNTRSMGISPWISGTDWLTGNLGDKNNYYYCDAYLDAVRALDFLASREKVKTNRIFARGESQGGALSFAVAALDDRIRGVIASIPFLCDLPNYYDIKKKVTDENQWPMSDFDSKLTEQNVTLEKALETMSYIDIKNLASLIACPVLMSSGLQDPVCPSYTNFAAYNQLTTAKEYRICKDCQHTVEGSFYNYIDTWISRRIKELDDAETGLKNLSQEENVVQVAPNPVIDKLRITLREKEEGVSLTLYGLNGSAILQQKLLGKYTHTLDCSALAKGIYVLQVVMTDGRIFHQRVIK
jgi:cephalosporin-C deacetylase